MQSFYLMLAALWLAALVYFVGQRPTNWLIVALAGLMLVWNLVRWYTLKPIQPPRNPLADASRRPEPTEDNPDFDFQPPERPANGG